MALVALVAALRGQSSLRARVGVVMFFALSLGAQVLYAPPGIEGLLVAIIAPVSMAWMLETLIVEVRRWAAAQRGLEISETPILTGVLVAVVRILRGLLGLLMWAIRMLFDPKSTGRGLREWILDTAPIAPGRSLASMRAAEAESRANSSAATAEQIRQTANEERLALEDRFRDERQEAEAERARIEQDAAERLAQVKQKAAKELAAVKEEAAEQVAQARQEAEQRVRVLTESTAADAGQAADRVARLESELARMRSELDHARAQAARVPKAEESARQARGELASLGRAYDLLEGYAGPRAILRTWYEGLRLAGDSRYGDASYLSDLAREWAPRLGRSESTARRYLADHLNDPMAGVGQDAED
jgi:hypothetical protein